MFRVMYHMDRMSLRLSQVFHAKKMGRNGLEHAYFQLFYQPSESSIIYDSYLDSIQILWLLL